MTDTNSGGPSERTSRTEARSRPAEATLQTSVQEWQDTFDAVNDLVAIVDREHRIIRTNQAMHTAFPGDTLENALCCRLVHGAEGPVKGCVCREVFETGRPAQIELREEHLGGHWFDVRAYPIRDQGGTVVRAVHIIQDITERKQVERELRQRTQDLSERIKELKCIYDIFHLAEREGATIEDILQGAVEFLLSSLQYPESACARITFDGAEFRTGTFRETAWRQEAHIVVYGERLGAVEVFYTEKRCGRDDGFFLKEERALIDAVGERLGRIAEHKRAEQQLRVTAEKLAESEERLCLALSAADVGIWRWVPAMNRDTRGGSFNRILGLEPVESTQPVEDFVDRVHPEDRPAVKKAIESAARERKLYVAEFRIVRPDGEVRWLYDRGMGTYNDKGEMTHMTGAVVDITDRKQMEKDLKRTMKGLERSNRDLERFAYVASHDLQEPLRMVSSYTQLLAKRYKDALDKDANEFIDYAVDGVQRMQGLLDSLLALSRADRSSKPFARTECRDVLASALKNLEVLIVENDATITYDGLPAIMADEGQIVQLFQNLVANAIRYRGEAAPEVQVSAERKNGDWEFSVRDNGIGIAAEHYERIFEMFQRLYGLGEYPGTGMGLAVCKRIVERHGGRIWVDSEPGKGSTFRFTIAAASGSSGSTRPTA